MLLGDLKEDGIVIHSVNLPKYENKRWGEIDFLIITKQRVIALEHWVDQFQLEHTGQAPAE